MFALVPWDGVTAEYKLNKKQHVHIRRLKIPPFFKTVNH